MRLLHTHQLIQSPHAQQLPLWSSTLRATYHCSSHPGQPGPVPGIQSTLKLLKLAHPQPAFLPHPCFSCGNHNKGSCLHSLSLPLSPIWPHGNVWPSSQERRNESLFQWCSDLLASIVIHFYFKTDPFTHSFHSELSVGLVLSGIFQSSMPMPPPPFPKFIKNWL